VKVEDLIRFATSLEEKAFELESAIADPSGHAAPVKLDGTLGRIARMDEMQSQQMALAAQRRNQQQLSSVKAALQRIEKGTFGLCIQCGGDIGMNRLTAIPDAPLCLTCAARQAG